MTVIMPEFPTAVTSCSNLFTRPVRAGGRQGLRPSREAAVADAVLAERRKGGGRVSSQDDYSQLDDFEVLEERRRVQGWLATLTDKYRALNQEMTRRETLRWMAEP